MIDWVTFVAPLSHSRGPRGPFFAGDISATRPDAGSPTGCTVDWKVARRKSLPGYLATSIQVKTTIDDEGRPAIWVSGNPAKWFQGHNIFGSSDLYSIVLAILYRICEEATIEPSTEDLNLWRAGKIKLVRVDVTNSFDFETLARVRNALRSLDGSAHLKHRGRGLFSGDSLTFGRGSRRWSLTLYAKGAEIAIKDHRLPIELLCTPLSGFAQGLLRSEVRVLQPQLITEQLQYASEWRENTATELHSRLQAGLNIAEASMLEPKIVEGLPSQLRGPYQLWIDGHDLRGIYPRNTFYRHRAALLKHGIDVAVKQATPGGGLSNVVPLRTVLHGYPVGVPAWSLGTELYFDPRSKAA